MQEITFYPSKAIRLIGTLGMLGFIVTGIWAAYRQDIFFGHLVYLLAGLNFFMSVTTMLTGASYLKLRDDEFEYGDLFRKHCVKWEDVKNFEIWTPLHRYITAKQVGWNYKEGVEVSKSVKINKWVGIDDSLADTYGMKPDELLSLMNEHLANHGDKRS